jgi:hypothetical protein
MKATFAAATALLATTYAATVKLETTKCLNSENTPPQQFDVALNSISPVAKGQSTLIIAHSKTLTNPTLDLPSVCGLRILSASDNVDIATIQCQAFRDTEGKLQGSALFTSDNTAQIATNPIQEKSIWCTTSRPQNLSNSTISSAAPQSTASGNATLPITASSNATTILTTVLASASAGLPSLSANGTVPSATQTPPSPPSQTGGEAPPKPSETKGAASTLGVGVGVVAAAFAALLL